MQGRDAGGGFGVEEREGALPPAVPGETGTDARSVKITNGGSYR